MSLPALLERKYPCPQGATLSIASPEVIQNQSIAGVEKGTMRNSTLPADSALVERIPGMEHIVSVHELFQRSVDRVPDLPCLGTQVDGVYQWVSYKKVGEMRAQLGRGFVSLGAAAGCNIAVYAKNRVEWVLVELACVAHSMCSVGLYDALGPDSVQYVASHAECPIAVVSGDKVKAVIAVASSCTHLKHIVSMDAGAVTDATRKDAERAGVQLHAWDEVLAMGDPTENAEFPRPPATNDTFCIVYTSGSTGQPKGVVITHANAISVIAGMYYSDCRPVLDAEVHLSYLPLAHVAEKLSYLMVVSAGGCIGFYGGDNAKLLADIQSLRPTFMIGAPRVYQRVRDKFIQALNKSWFTRKLLGWGLPAKRRAVEQGGQTPMWDALLFKKLNAKLGGRVRFVISASAPLDTTVAEFLQLALCIPVVQGYGLSETFGPATLGYLSDRPVSDIQCGPPLPSFEFKLIDAIEAGYTLEDKPFPRGEILIRGPGVYPGYFKDPDRTKEMLDEDGWLHTGDVGLYNARGSLQVIDRLKNIFKLAQGEFVPSETVEGVIVRSAHVQQAYISGGVMGSAFLVAVVVPDPDTVFELAESLALGREVDEAAANKDMKAICQSEAVRNAILADIHRSQEAAKLSRFLMIKDCILEDEPWSVDNDCLTPTFKIRREQIKKRYADSLAELHAEIMAR